MRVDFATGLSTALHLADALAIASLAAAWADQRIVQIPWGIFYFIYWAAHAFKIRRESNKPGTSTADNDVNYKRVKHCTVCCKNAYM